MLVPHTTDEVVRDQRKKLVKRDHMRMILASKLCEQSRIALGRFADRGANTITVIQLLSILDPAV